MENTTDRRSENNRVDVSRLHVMDREREARRTDQPGDDPISRMPCGHNIERSRLVMECRNLMRAGEFRFKCQHVSTIDRPGIACSQPIEYVNLRQIATLTDEEKWEFEIGMSQNYIDNSNVIQICPKCSNYCSRQHLTNKRVICVVCSTVNIPFEFCWNCRGIWKSDDNIHCGNDTCTSREPNVSVDASLTDPVTPEVVVYDSRTELPVSSAHNDVCDYLVADAASGQMPDGRSDFTTEESSLSDVGIDTANESVIVDDTQQEPPLPVVIQDTVIGDQSVTRDEQDVPSAGHLNEQACSNCTPRQIACVCGKTSCFIAELLNAKWGYMNAYK